MNAFTGQDNDTPVDAIRAGSNRNPGRGKRAAWQPAPWCVMQSLRPVQFRVWIRVQIRAAAQLSQPAAAQAIHPVADRLSYLLLLQWQPAVRVVRQRALRAQQPLSRIQLQPAPNDPRQPVFRMPRQPRQS